MKKIVLLLLLSISAVTYAQRNPFSNLIEKNGKIGIGTKSPDALLTVKGDIHTQEVRVDLEGAVAPDYVFETYYKGFSTLNPDYEMLSLDALQLFIEENHHLPNVPAASQLEKEGLNLKAFNLLLLEKIEELTLYIIEQQKQIDDLKLKLESKK